MALEASPPYQLEELASLLQMVLEGSPVSLEFIMWWRKMVPYSKPLFDWKSCKPCYMHVAMYVFIVKKPKVRFNVLI